MKYTILDAGFPMAVVTDGEQAKSIAAYTPGMLIDRLRYHAASHAGDDGAEVAMMLEAAAAMLEKVIQKHYGTSEPKEGKRAEGGMLDAKPGRATGTITPDEILKEVRKQTGGDVLSAEVLRALREGANKE